MSIRSQKLGTIIFWITWPGLWVILRWSYRTRVLVASGSKVLVMKSWLGPGDWSLPGGGVHRGEAPELAAIREVEEETGLTIEREQLVPTAERVFRDNGLSFRYQEYKVELNEMPTVRPQPGEVAVVEWMEKSVLNASNANYDVIAGLAAIGVVDKL